MALINILPTLKSNGNESTEFSITASSNETPSNTFFHAYKTFTPGSGYWNGSDSGEGWLQIRTNSCYGVSDIKFIRGAGVPFCTKGELVGSNDEVNWEFLANIETVESGYSTLITLGKVVKYKYYRFLVKEGSHCFGKIEMYIDDNLFVERPSTSRKNANLVYTLPMNTTSLIKTKVNDSRVGLLGMANDGDNFGDLYVVGRDGKAHLTKSGIKNEILFEGVVNDIGVYNLGKSVSTHKFLSIYGDIANGSYSYSMLIEVEELKAKDYIFEIYEQNYLVIRLISDNEIEVKSKYTAGHYDGRITKIIGIY